tara:strand:- start:3473 stop:3742 length:270 start_codon:yes stop_codon:yes gene_type:complete
MITAKDDYLGLLKKVQAELNKLNNLNGKADLEKLLSDIEKCNKAAKEYSYPTPFPAKLIEEITAMQKRLDYYYKTGLDAPSLTSEFTGP